MSNYYDGVFQRIAHYRGPPQRSPYYPLWKSVLEAAKPHHRILDAGCGPGQFGELCVQTGHTYTGLDYSKEAIELARAKGFGSYIHVDLEQDLSPISAGDYDVFTAVESLEHIEKDREVLAAIPHGKAVIISGPNYYAEGHCRVFPTYPSFRGRYASLLHIEKGLGLSGRNARGETTQVFIIKGIKRLNAT